jgi:hypothetical protein
MIDWIDWDFVLIMSAAIALALYHVFFPHD